MVWELFIGGYYTAVISRNLVFNIRQEVFAKLLRLPAQYYLDNTSGHITAKIMYNVEQLTAASTESLRTLVQQGLITLGLLGYLLYTNWRLTLCILVFGPLIGLLIRKAAKRMRRLSIQVQDTMGDVNHVVQETVNGNLVVKGFGGQTYEQSRFKEKSCRKPASWFKNGGSATIEQPSGAVHYVHCFGNYYLDCLTPRNST